MHYFSSKDFDNICVIRKLADHARNTVYDATVI